MSKAKMGYKTTFRRYYILSKPGIVRANIITATAGYLYASRFDIDWTVLVGLLAGLTALIAGACAYNNYLDRGIDSRMQRTKKRGLVTGELTIGQALIYATATTIGGLLLLAYTQNTLTLLLAVIALVDYVVLYGWTKRKTVHGTLVGTLSGSIPLVAGYTAVTGRFDLDAWLLLALMTAWQMAHFYAIALYRQKDYAAAKIPVMPVVYGTHITQIQILIYISLFLVSALCLVVLGDLGVVAGLVLIGVGIWWLIRALSKFGKLASDAWGKRVFLSSLIVMLGMAFCLAFGTVLQS